MKIHIKLLLVIALVLPGCDDFLTEVPQDAYSESSIYSTEADIRLLVNGLYQSVNGFSRDNGGFSLRSEFVYLNFTDDNYNRLRNKSTDLDFASTSQVVQNEYDVRFTPIAYCNDFLIKVDQAEIDIDTDLLNRYKAEVRFIRAFHYDRLNFLFGDIPLLTEPIGLDEFPLRTNRNAVFDFVTNELTEIANDLPWSYSDNDVGRITRGAASGLLARHALNGLSWYGDDARLYEIARDAAGEVYNEGPYTLASGVAGFSSLFTLDAENGGVPGIIWTSNYDIATRSHNYARMALPKGAFSGERVNNSHYLTPTNKLVEAFQMSNGLDIRDPASGYDPANPWVDRDPRLDITIIRAGDSIPQIGGDGISPIYVFDAHPDIRPENGVATDDVTNGGVGRTGYSFQKYMHYDFITSQEDHIDYIMMRFAEIILMYAEGLAGADGNIGAATTLVDEVRSRVGMPGVTDSYGAVNGVDHMIEIILQERRFEFACEGPHRYMDIKRYRLGEDLFVSGTDPGEGPTVYGIPIGAGGVSDSTVLEGSLDFSEKFVAGVRSFDPNTYYWWPLPQESVDRNPELLKDPI